MVPVSAVNPQPEATREIYRLIKQMRSGLQNSFADCDCVDCQKCGEQWATWITPEFMSFTDGLGVDWSEPIEVCCAGTLGRERTTIMADYIGQGLAQSESFTISPFHIRIAQGNQTPGRFWPHGIKKPDECSLYTLHITFTIDADLKIDAM